MASGGYCLCGFADDDGREMIECASGRSGCGGWIHSACFRMTPQDRAAALAADTWTCAWCEGRVWDVPAAQAYAREVSLAHRRLVADAAAATYESDESSPGGVALAAASASAKKQGGSKVDAGMAKAGTQGGGGASKAASKAPGAGKGGKVSTCWG